MKTLRQGSKGINVVQLQILLNKHLNPSIKIKSDGHFSNQTKEAVIIFQKKHNLSSDGIAGPNTWKALTNIKKSNLVTTQKDLSLTIGAPWYNIAQAELGVKEILGRNNNNQRILEYHSTTSLGAKTDEIPWCSSFVNWVVRQAGMKGTDNALAKSWLEWGMKVVTPKVGDIVIIKRINKNNDSATGSSTGYHVGFFVTQNKFVISILGGNQSNSVKKSNFMLRSYEVVGYRRPNNSSIGVPIYTPNIISRIA